MERGLNRLFVAVGSVAAVAVLLAAFAIVWLLPRGPETTNASGQAGNSQQVVTSGASGSEADTMVGQTVPPVGGSGVAVSDQPHITVHGMGVVTAKPDIVNLQVGVQIQKDTLTDAQSQAASAMNTIQQQLKSAGIADNDISTAQYNVSPVMDYPQNGAPHVTGFQVTNILNVKIRDISKAGSLIDSMVSSGANTIYGVSFDFSDPSAVMNQARQQAMADAKNQASQYASLAGVTLGAPIAIEDAGSSLPPTPMSVDTNARVAAGAAASTPINPGQQQVTVQVNVVYAIK